MEYHLLHLYILYLTNYIVSLDHSPFSPPQKLVFQLLSFNAHLFCEYNTNFLILPSLSSFPSQSIVYLLLLNLALYYPQYHL